MAIIKYKDQIYGGVGRTPMATETTPGAILIDNSTIGITEDGTIFVKGFDEDNMATDDDITNIFA